MLRSPPFTRSLAKKAEQETLRPASTKVARSEKSESENIETGMALQGKTITAPASLHGSTQKTSISSSSLQARKKKLELEAAEAKARIQMELIDKRLAADIADLQEEYSPPSENSNASRVETWLRSNRHELDSRCAHDMEQQMGTHCPPVRGNAGTEELVQVLASALKDLASSSNGQNDKLLRRLSTPKDLPMFFGDPMEWLYFKQAYEESNEVCNFSAKENLWRLRKALHGAAKETVSGLLITAASPDLIMSTLQLQFGNPDVIISHVISDIKRLQPMSQDYYKEIVPFAVKVKNFVASVQAVGRVEVIQGVHIVTIILSKLPTVLLSKWADYCQLHYTEHTSTKMELLSEFLTNEAVKISTCCPNLQCNVRPNINRRHLETFLQRKQNVLMQDAKMEKCRYCHLSKHMLPECKQFKRALRKDRWRFVKQYGLCYKCLVSRHSRETCPAAACDIDDCGLDHHRLLHYPVSTDNTRVEICAPKDPVVDASSHPQTVNNVSADCKILLKVVPINIYGPNGKFSTTALLDDGSTITLISADLAVRAGLQGCRETISVCGPWNGDQITYVANIVKFKLSNQDGNMFCINARSIKELLLPKQDLSMVDIKNFRHLYNLKDKISCNLSKPEILIGQDNYHLLLSKELIIGKLNEPCASLTALGWCIHGRVPLPVHVNQNHSALCLAPEVDNQREWDDIHEEIRRSFSIESMGISSRPRENSEEVKAVARLEQTATLVNGRWYVGLPWKDVNCKLPNSYPNALSRLKGVEKKILNNKEYGKRYVERIKHLFVNDFAEENDTVDTSRTWYLPHFGVDNPNKKKLRLVFDAAAKTNGLCLNDYFFKGPDLLKSLLGIMLRFRENKIAVIGDIKDMFLRVKIINEDRNAFSFLWRDNPSEPVKKFVMSSLIFGANCSPFIAQFIKNKNAQRFSASMPSAVAAICNQHYMDDYIDSVCDEITAVQLVKDISYIYKNGGFQMCNWASNSETVLRSFPEEDLGSTAVRFKVDQQDDSERTLGLLWFPKEDTLGFDVSFKRIPSNLINGEQVPSKRQMLRVIMSIFDVFGFLSPFTINGKILLQDTWRLKINWDDPISDDIFTRWRKWVDVLKSVKNIRIFRYYVSAAAAHSSTESMYEVNCHNYRNLQLHIFCDASPKAMCAVAYWRWLNNDNQVFVSFIASKCRVAPVKPTSVPRLELQAALLAARLGDTIKHEHKMESIRRYFWSDSTTTLHWIRNDARNYKAFVAHRLGEIDELTRVNEWRYVPSKLNVADLATRESYDESILKDEWFNGPKFLYQTEKVWPKEAFSTDIQNMNLEFVSVIQANLTDLPVPDCKRFSSWLRLQRTVTMVLKFIYKCRKQICVDNITIMEQAERLLIRQAQAESFNNDLYVIKNGKNLDKKSKLLTLSPFIDEHGILRAGGRIDAAADVDLEVKRPLILDGRHHLSRLIVRHYHIKLAHGNQETVVNELKQKYWIFRMRPTVKNVASTCMFCRIRKAKPQMPRMGDLPAARMAHHNRPFTYCGIDLFGPFQITIGRRQEKRYGVLFTCLTVRAIHIELVQTLSTDSLILALRRMAARRGWPSHIYSDNGTNLRGADVELKRSIQELDQETLFSKSPVCKLHDCLVIYTTCQSPLGWGMGAPHPEREGFPKGCAKGTCTEGRSLCYTNGRSRKYGKQSTIDSRVCRIWEQGSADSKPLFTWIILKHASIRKIRRL